MESNDKLEQLLRQMYAQEALHDEDIDTKDIVDEEWTKFEAEHFGENEKMRNGENEKPLQRNLISHFLILPLSKFQKIAALFIGVLMLSGITYAAVHMISGSSEATQKPQTNAIANTELKKINHETAEQDSTLMQTVIFEDAELITILDDIATFYQVEPVFKKEASKHIRLYFTWNKKQDLDTIIDTFNKFERIHITRYDKILIID